MDDNAYDYDVLGDDVDPDDLFDEMKSSMAEMCKLINATSSPAKNAALDEQLLDLLVKMVFGSNAIENAGSQIDLTRELCRAIFKGEAVPDEIEEKGREFSVIKEDLERRGLPAGTQAVLRSRCEIIQHAKAASHIIFEVCVQGKDLSEDIILDTHRILVYKVDTEQGIKWKEYAGVPSAMARMIFSMNKDLETANTNGKLDPVAFASKYCHTFVNIHPFMDGNGRICRLILNALLLKYGGNLVCFGEQEGDCQQYLTIAAEASLAEMSQSDGFNDGEFGAPKHYKKLATFALQHFAKNIKHLVKTLKQS